MALFGDLFGSSKKNDKSTTTSRPYGPLEPYLQRGFEYAQQGYNQSGLSPETAAYLNYVPGRALGGSPLNRQAGNQLAGILSGQYLNQPNPQLQNVIDASARDATNAVNSTYAASGRYGSGAHNAAVARAVGDISSGLRFGDYNNQLGRLDSAIRFAPQLAEQDYADLDRLRDAGQLRENFQFNRAGNFLNLLGGNYGGTQTTSQRASGPSSGSQLLGLGLSALGSFF